MTKTVLHIGVTVDASRVVDCAKELQTRLPPDQWTVLAQLAAEIVARHEQVATGQRMLVVAARPEEVQEVARAAGFPVAGVD